MDTRKKTAWTLRSVRFLSRSSWDSFNCSAMSNCWYAHISHCLAAVSTCSYSLRSLRHLSYFSNELCSIDEPASQFARLEKFHAFLTSTTNPALPTFYWWCAMQTNDSQKATKMVQTKLQHEQNSSKNATIKVFPFLQTTKWSISHKLHSPTPLRVRITLFFVVLSPANKKCSRHNCNEDESRTVLITITVNMANHHSNASGDHWRRKYVKYVNPTQISPCHCISDKQKTDKDEWSHFVEVQNKL